MRESIKDKFVVCGIDELPDFRGKSVTHVLSILDPERDDPDAFGDYGQHRRLTLRFHDIIDPAPGMILPQRKDVEALLTFGEGIDLVPEKSDHLLVHCHMGVSRSTAAMTTLLLQDHPQADEGTILARILRVRPQMWPNSRMIAFADELLGRGGRLNAALRRLYGHQVKVRPELAEAIRSYGRGREVDSALLD
ncbi:tyrosine phosphatase family protein [Chelatococcus reniformis]|uniref:Protein-tyrosine-phosphatase n=1 Tax=Chelatococcus reniformis TaxID=1494448 RepID=A0A916UR71_9HYPH|nr:protein-tyrosine-phosphatase [Chelatococcus reniformis]GGC84350.1 protein-tyrosine-phosphatase [Chelatococcus reniformis]